MKMKKVLALLLAMAMMLTLFAGCGGDEQSGGSGSGSSGSSDSGSSGSSDSGSSGTSDPAEPMTLVVGCTNDVGSMFFGGTANSGKKIMRELCYEPLFYMNQAGEMYPVLAKNYESLGNGVYSIELFDYIYDSAGNHFTAADAIYSMDLYIADGQDSSNYNTLVDYHATGDYTFEMTLQPETVGQIEALLTYMHFVTKASYEASPDGMTTTPVGTGAYVLTESIAGSSYTFEKRDDYWQTDPEYVNVRTANYLDKVEMKIIPDESTLAMALESGDIEFSIDIGAADVANFTNEDGTAKDGYMLMNATNNAHVHLTFNCGPDSPCEDINLRRAIAYAIDAAACGYAAHGNSAKVCVAATNPGLADSSDDFGNGNYFPYDPEYAKELVAQSSYNGETIRILVCPAEQVSSCAPLIQEYCNAVGIKVELLQYDFAQYRKYKVDETGLEYDAELLGVTSSDDYVYRSLVELDINAYSNGKNHLFITDNKLQALYDEAKGAATNSPEAVKALLDYVEENCYVYSMYYAPILYFGKDIIKEAETGFLQYPILSGFVVER